jgi:hypothetical protein
MLPFLRLAIVRNRIQMGNSHSEEIHGTQFFDGLPTAKTVRHD